MIAKLSAAYLLGAVTVLNLAMLAGAVVVPWALGASWVLLGLVSVSAGGRVYQLRVREHRRIDRALHAYERRRHERHTPVDSLAALGLYHVVTPPRPARAEEVPPTVPIPQVAGVELRAALAAGRRARR
jgi:hypothetical protein